jgi:hypothetical protein
VKLSNKALLAYASVHLEAIKSPLRVMIVLDVVAECVEEFFVQTDFQYLEVST